MSFSDPWESSKRIGQLEQELEDGRKLVFLLASRLGGDVELAVDELASLDRNSWLTITRDPVNATVVVRCRTRPKPLADQVHVTVQTRIGNDVFDLGECDLSSPDDPALATVLRSLAAEIENKETDSGS